jgi:hypothetical protein
VSKNPRKALFSKHEERTEKEYECEFKARKKKKDMPVRAGTKTRFYTKKGVEIRRKRGKWCASTAAVFLCSDARDTQQCKTEKRNATLHSPS